VKKAMPERCPKVNRGKGKGWSLLLLERKRKVQKTEKPLKGGKAAGKLG